MMKLRISHCFVICTLMVVTIPYKGVLSKSTEGLRTNSFTKSNNATGSQDNSRSNEKNTLKLLADLREDVELKCPVTTHASLTQYEWYKQNTNDFGRKRMTQFRGRFELSSQGQVKIRSLTYEDSGVYICKLASSKDSYFIELTVSGNDGFNNNNLLKSSGSRKGNMEESFSEPSIIRDHLPKGKTFHVAKGSSLLLLKCESKGNPRPTITWYKDDKILSSSRGNMSALKLMNLSEHDNGIYKCESVNIFGLSLYEVTIQVTDAWHGSTEILELSPTNATVLEGGSVNISCLARFETDPWFFWLKKLTSYKAESVKVFFHKDTSSHYEVLQSTSVKLRGEQIYSSELILTNVTKNDAGAYFCAAAGLQGFNYSETTVIVESDPSHLEFYNPKSVAAQWAILWTSAFIVLVILIVLCFVRIYGCHSNPNSKSESNKIIPSSLGKTLLPERSPQTMSTHCTTTHLQCQHSSFVPLMVGSCTLSSQYQDRGSSDESLSPWQSPENFNGPGDVESYGSRISRNSTLLADLEAARSYCNISDCSGCSESEYDIKLWGNSSHGYVSNVSNYQNRKSRTRHSNPRSMPISSAPLNSPCSQSSIGDSASHLSCSYHYPNNLIFKKPNVYQSKRKHLSSSQYPYNHS